ncbi:hypothetical protein [Mycetohabitans rhizoxinica]|uniref:hypothetical protein n=1 Tax=Mycetohabitans rhizoxinica TaxID=412963 RepID=UPI0039F5FE6A
MCNALRWLARAGAAWRMLPANFPPWKAWCISKLNAGCERAASKRWFKICVRCCVLRRAGKLSPVRWF